MTERRVPCWTREERWLAVTEPATIHCNATVIWLSLLKWRVCSVTFDFIFSFFGFFSHRAGSELSGSESRRPRETQVVNLCFNGLLKRTISLLSSVPH